MSNNPIVVESPTDADPAVLGGVVDGGAESSEVAVSVPVTLPDEAENNVLTEAEVFAPGNANGGQASLDNAPAESEGQGTDGATGGLMASGDPSAD